MEEHPEAQDLNSAESLNLDRMRRRNYCSSKVESLKRMVKFFVSVCVFSLAMALFFSIFSLFPHSFSLYFSFSLLNHALDRKYMFLLCNGILFLLATSNSSSLQDSHRSSHHHHHDADVDDTSAIQSADLADVGPTNPIEEEEEEEEGFEEVDQEEGMKSEELEVVESTEELNKKIEEFIRKMKEEMRIEAAAQPHTQLIAV